EQVTEPYHLILMDCEMPNLDGYGATKRICALRKNSPTPTRIYGLSAHALAEYRDKGMASGMDGFLTKPVKLKELEKLLQEVSR
ncbi:MAG TPA: response regulator, partial [Pseudomonadales bacterium]|nr:response regulator [Pseudomonadales bacterium]